MALRIRMDDFGKQLARSPIIGQGNSAMANRRSKSWSAVWLVLLVVAGCQTSSGYRAADLPPQFHPPVARSTQSLDLSQLARGSTGSDVIQPGDLLALSVSTGLDTGETEPKLLRVANDGAVDVPLVGAVRVAGFEPPVAEMSIRNASMRGDVYRSPQVSLQFASRQGNAVTVLGAVNAPGTYRLSNANSNVLGALVAAGGLNEFADTIVELHHAPSGAAHGNPRDAMEGGIQSVNYRRPDGPASVRIDLLQAESIPDEALRVHDGTAIMVRQRPPQLVYVMGLVNEAGQFEMQPDEEIRLLDALAMAGGRRLEIADKVRVIRHVPHLDEPITIAASVREAQRNGRANIRLAPGDVVHVEETSATLIVDTLTNFIRFGFTAGIPGI